MTEGSARPDPTAKRRRRRASTRPHVSIPELGLTLKWIREDLGLTQDAAAEKVGYSAVQLGRFERGVQAPSVAALGEIISGYHVTRTMGWHLHELAAPAIMLAPTDALRSYVRAEESLMVSLDRFQERGVAAAFIDPLWNVLACNTLFSDALPGLERSWSIPLWMFSEQGKTAVVDPEDEAAWSVSMWKAALGRHRTSDQARNLVAGLAQNSEARRLWAASLAVATGRDARRPMHARDSQGNLVSYQLALTEGLSAHHVQLLTATPEPYSGPTDIPQVESRR